jgi:hypothetical protein
MSKDKSEMDDSELVIVSDLRKMLQLFNEDLGQYINVEERFKLGRVLTIVDAAISDPEQRKAIKNLVNNEWWNNGVRPTESAMTNPHSDIRALCEALGFELYPEKKSDLPTEKENLSWISKRYTNAVTTK